MITVLTVIGTRPEVIKLAPLISLLKVNSYFNSKVCLTHQHQELLEPFLLDAKITPDYKIEPNPNTSTLYQSAAHILKQLGDLMAELKPDVVIVQGDTTTAFAATLAAFYNQIPVAHVEGGLRTGNLYSPWPEEAHRCMIDQLATYFFAPTRAAQNNLIKEGVDPQKVWLVGNTSMDALRLTPEAPASQASENLKQIIVTIHRRENQNAALHAIGGAICSIAEQFPAIKILFFLHPNPIIYNYARQTFAGKSNIQLMKPLDHPSFIQLMRESLFIITDSGGIQEEAACLGKPIIVVRDETERSENLEQGIGRLVGTQAKDIILSCQELITNERLRTQMSKKHSLYGDGYAADRIITILETELRRNK